MHNAIIIILTKFHVPSSNPFSVYGRNRDFFFFFKLEANYFTILW